MFKRCALIQLLWFPLMIVVGLVVALIAPTFIPQPNSRPPKATSVASAEPPAAEGWREPVCILNSVDGYALAVFGHIRTKFSQSNMVISHLSLVDQGKPTSGMIPGDLAEEDGWYWPNYRIACGDKKFTVTKVEPIVLPGRREIVWLDYKQREITLEGDRRVVTPERIVFRAPRLTPNDVDAIEARYERLRNRGEQRDTQEVETLLGQVFLWALQDSGRGVAALKNFRETFRPDGAYGEAEATYREMYRAITGRPL